MIGITSYGAYIPRYRMNRKVIFDQLGWFNAANAAVARGEKAVCNCDEDSITMAVAAATDCLNGTNRENIEGLCFASASFPFAERQNSAIVSSALDLPAGIRSADLGGSLKSGTTALLSGLDGARDGGVAMVCASDCRVPVCASSDEHTFGDGAAAFLLGTEGVIAEFKGSSSVSHDFADFRRLPEDRYSHGWEPRWIRDEGYEKFIPEAALALSEKYNLNIGDFAKIIISCPVAAAVRGIIKTLGAKPEQIQNNMMANVGDTGTAWSLMMLVAALEESKAGDKILVLSYGNGCDAICFEVTDAIKEVKKDRKGIKGHLVVKSDLSVYGKYLAFKNIMPIDIGVRGEEMSITPMSMLWREGKGMSALIGTKCKACGTPQYPKQRVCVNPECGAIDQMQDYRFSDKKGTLASFTGDSLAYSLDPPAVYGLVDFEGGGRMFADITDCNLDEVKVGMPVTMSYRRKSSDPRRAFYNYFWCAVPIEK